MSAAGRRRRARGGHRRHLDVVRLAWRASAAKAVVWFGDAPPHGVEPHGDAFPGGCPCGTTGHAGPESCREIGVAVYAIGCLPGLRQFSGAEAVFRAVARATRGMFLPLHDAALLVRLITSALQQAESPAHRHPRARPDHREQPPPTPRPTRMSASAG